MMFKPKITSSALLSVSLLALTPPLVLTTKQIALACLSGLSKCSGEINQEPETVLNLCNQTSDSKINIAYAYRDSDDEWQSKGWIVIPPGECSRGEFGNYQGVVYIGGESAQTSWGKGTSLCLNNNKKSFQISDSQLDCKKIEMSKVWVSDGENTYNFFDFSHKVGKGTTKTSFHQLSSTESSKTTSIKSLKSQK